MMKKSRIVALAEAVEASLAITAKPQLIHELITDQLMENHHDDRDLALEEAVALLDPVRHHFEEKQRTAEASGESWHVEVFGTEGEYLRGSSFTDRTLPARERQIRSHRRFIPDVQNALWALSPLEFEAACTSIIKMMGCPSPFTSPLRDDGGIDFYGKLHLVGRLDQKFPYGGIDNRLGVWLIGQAKHYSLNNPVQTSHIREMVGSVELARTGGAIHSWEGLDLRPFDAVVQLFFTTGRFSSGAKRLLDRSGIIAMNGEQLATFLTDTGIGIQTASSSFDVAVFRKDLAL